MALYASVSQIKGALRIIDNVDDTLITLAANAATDLISGYCGRDFNSTTATRLFAPHENYVLEINDLVTLTTLKTSTLGDGNFDVTWAAKDYQLEPLNGYTGGLAQPFTRIRAVDRYLFPDAYGEVSVQITGVWGWPAIPNTVTQAAVIQAGRIFKRNESLLGVAGIADFGAIRVSNRIDPDVAQLLQPYVRHVGAA
jgi:hypothetical protein